jgi:hypothetical protein
MAAVRLVAFCSFNPEVAMRSNQEIIERARQVLQRNTKKSSIEPVEQRDEIIPGTWYRDERGRMVQVISASPIAVKFYREGFSDEYQTSRREFLKFRKVKK